MARPITVDSFQTGEEELEGLQKRLYLLEGERKANYDTSNVTLRQNKETLAQLQKEKKELSAQLQALSRQVNATAAKPKQSESAEGIKYRRRLD